MIQTVGFLSLRKTPNDRLEIAMQMHDVMSVVREFNGHLRVLHERFFAPKKKKKKEKEKRT